VFKEGGVALDESFLSSGHRRRRALNPTCRPGRKRHNRCTQRDRQKLSGLFEAGLILLGMNAIGGADIDAEESLMQNQ